LTEAKDGQEGLNLVLKIPYDVAFVKLNTKMDGLIGLFKRKAKEGGSITVRFDVICVQ
jgi:hypothetical protein